jgi:integrase
VFNAARDLLKDFPKVTPHDLSHTAASLAVSAGGNVLALARMLGHDDPRLTLRTFADLFDSELDALANVLDRTVLRRYDHQLPTVTVKLSEKTYPVRSSKLHDCP